MFSTHAHTRVLDEADHRLQSDQTSRRGQPVRSRNRPTSAPCTSSFCGGPRRCTVPEEHREAHPGEWSTADPATSIGARRQTHGLARGTSSTSAAMVSSPMGKRQWSVSRWLATIRPRAVGDRLCRIAKYGPRTPAVKRLVCHVICGTVPTYSIGLPRQEARCVAWQGSS